MTIICALHDPKHRCTWIGSDRLTKRYSGRAMDMGPKFAVYGPWAAGVSGDGRVNDILINNAKTILDGLSGPMEFIARFIAVLKEHDFDLSPANNESPPNSNQTIVLAHANDEPWSITGDFCCIPGGRFTAEGSGGPYALGAAFAQRNMQVPPSKLVETAILAAIEHDTSCGGEVWLHKLEKT